MGLYLEIFPTGARCWRFRYRLNNKAEKVEKEKAELRQQAWRECYKAAQKKGQDAPLRPDSSISAPLPRRLVTHDATAEKLYEILHDNPAGVLLIRDELSSWLETLDKPGREGERGFFSLPGTETPVTRWTESGGEAFM